MLAGLGLWGVVPAFLGTFHASFAGPLEPDAVYCGRPSPFAATFCRVLCRCLPVAIVVVTATGRTLDFSWQVFDDIGQPIERQIEKNVQRIFPEDPICCPFCHTPFVHLIT